MPIVSAICPNCGGTLQVDNVKDAGICEFCGNPFVIESAINNYNSYTTNNFKADVINYHGNNPQTLLTRVKLFLEDGNFTKASEYCEKVLDIEAENAYAYLYNLMAKLNVRTSRELETCHRIGEYSKQDANYNWINWTECTSIINNSSVFQKALRFADPDLKKELENISDKNLEFHYNLYLDKMKKAQGEKELLECENVFSSIAYYKDSRELAEKCKQSIKKRQEIDKEIYELKDRIREYERNADVIKKPGLAKFLAIIVILLMIFGVGCLIYFSVNDDDYMWIGIVLIVLYFVFGSTFNNLTKHYEWAWKLDKKIGCLLIAFYHFIFAIAILMKLKKSKSLLAQVEYMQKQIEQLEKEKI